MWLYPHRVFHLSSLYSNELLTGFLHRAILMTEWVGVLVILAGRAEHQQPPTQNPPPALDLSQKRGERETREKGAILFGASL